MIQPNTGADSKITLVIGGTGKTGRRVAERLKAAGRAVRIGSRASSPAFDWEDRSGWTGALDGVHAVYITYYPDLLMPEAPERIGAFADLAVKQGVRRLVLLSGRGEEGAENCERALQASGADWTVLRASWFAQNFSENVLLDPVLAREVVLPTGDVGEPFIHTDDIADVAVLVLTQDGHVGRTYDLTGPRLLTFREAVGEIAGATGRDIRYVQISAADFADGLAQDGTPEDLRAVLIELFTQVLDGRNSSVSGDVERLLGRSPRDFADYARETAATGVWNFDR